MPMASRAARSLALAAALAFAGCLGDTAAPRTPRPVSFSIAPAFSTSAASAVDFVHVRVTLLRSEGIAKDTTIDFPAGADSVALRLSVPIAGVSETLQLYLAMINAAGDTVYRGGPVPVTVTTLGSGPAVTVPVSYTGVGANADSVRITPRTATVIVGDSVVLAAVAYDSLGQPIPGTPVTWRSLDPTIAGLPSDTSGKVLALAPGVARIEASIPTGQADTAAVTVQLTAVAAVLVFSTEPPATTTPQSPFVVAVTAQDSAGRTATGFTGAVTVALQANPVAGTLTGTLTQNAVAGVATFSGLMLDNIGAGYSLRATSPSVNDTAISNAFSVVAPGNANAWINPAGGNWSNAANWSKGTVPTATDTVTITQSGTYTVNLDVNGTYGFLTVGAPSGTQTLSIAANTLTAGNGVFAPNAALSLSGNGTLAVAGALVVSGPMTWTGGTIDVRSGVLTLGGGEGAGFGGVATVATGAALDLAGGTFALDTITTVSGGGTVAVTAGTLNLNGQPLVINGDFATAGTGVLQMTQASDSLVVTGSAAFGGGSTTGLLTNGVLVLYGDFTQAVNATAFAPSGVFNTTLVGAVDQNIAFANPGSSYFQELLVDSTSASHNIVLQTNVVVADSLNSLPSLYGGSVIGAGTTQRLTVRGLLHLGNGEIPPVMSPPVLELYTNPQVDSIPGNGLSPDTLVLLPGVTAFPIGYSGVHLNNVRVSTNGAVTLDRSGAQFVPDTIAGNLRIDGSSNLTLGVQALPLVVTGNVETAGSGVLTMQLAGSQLTVGDSLIFGGGNESGLLTAGTLFLNGDFVQSGTGGQFAASGTHRVVFQRPTAGTQTIQMADSVNSYFQDLIASGATADTLRLLSNVQVQDSAVLNGTSVLVSNAAEALKLPLAGVLRVHSQAILEPFRVEAGSWVLDSTFLGGNYTRISPDTAVILDAANFNFGGSLGYISSSPVPVVAWKSVRIESDTLSSGGTNFAGALVVGGTGVYRPSSGVDSVYGFLRTEGSGILQMQTTLEPGSLVVQDSAVFGGGDEANNLTAGQLWIGGDFIQRGGSTTFQAGSGHFTIFDGAAGQSVTFASPGLGTSAFGNLVIARYDVQGNPLPAGITLGSDVAVVGVLQDASTATVEDSIVGNGHSVAALSMVLGAQFVMDSAALATGSDQIYTTGLTFRRMDPTITQWTISVPPGATIPNPLTQLPLSGLSFETVPTTGFYFEALITGGTGNATMTVGTPVNPSAATLNSGALYHNQNANGTVTTTWGGTALNNQ
jgi:hypothetical protein